MLTYDELLSEYNKLKAENAELKAEIAKKVRMLFQYNPAQKPSHPQP